jgi:hypothetical protein
VVVMYSLQGYNLTAVSKTLFLIDGRTLGAKAIRCTWPERLSASETTLRSRFHSALLWIVE